MRPKKATIVQLVVDACIFVIVGVPLLVVHIKVKAFQRGFYCDDESIRYPYKEDTVSMGVCAGVGVAISVAFFLAVELSQGLCGRSHSTSRVLLSLWEFGKMVAVYGFGAGTTILLTEIAKLVLGRLRPCFISACQPDFSAINCSAGYIEDVVCLNPMGLPDKEMGDIRKSFPSGHASYCAFTAFFISFYIQSRLHVQFSVFFKMALQVFVTLGALFVMFSRVSDYKHHWSDVLAGALLGFLVGLWTVLCLGGRVGFMKKMFKSGRAVNETILPINNDTTIVDESTFKRQSVTAAV